MAGERAMAVVGSEDAGEASVVDRMARVEAYSVAEAEARMVVGQTVRAEVRSVAEAEERMAVIVVAAVAGRRGMAEAGMAVAMVVVRVAVAMVVVHVVGKMAAALLVAELVVARAAGCMEEAWAAADLVATEAARVALAGRTPPSRRWQASARLPRRPTEDAK